MTPAQGITVAQLKAENEDYKSGQERYEQIIEDLKAENEALRKDAERYRGVRRVANHQGFTDEQFDQQTDSRVSRFDAAMAKEANHDR
ncbi:hypothetical protein ACLNBI_24910 [Pseudomonas guariconensis]|uniref:hypothetical protein n=1 Tax=Pseudomonas TaxID=286 RepID=UPI002958D465|nr:hypothetical protein [Pseudomonas sp. HTZ2]